MKNILLSFALLLAISPQLPVFAQGNGSDLIQQAVAAQGGPGALRGLQSLGIEGNASFWEPGQSFVAGGDPRFLGDATFSFTWDLAAGRASMAWDRDQKYPAPVRLKFTEIVLPTLGFVADDQGSHTPMSGIRVASHLRELHRSSPLLLVKAMDASGNVRAAGTQQLGSRSLPAVSYTDGRTTFTILFDSGTHLPAAIRTRDDDNINGDSNYDLVLADWKPVGGATIAHSLSYRINDVEVAKLTYRSVTANPAIAAATFAVPDAVRGKTKPPATGDVPYQWVLRRLFLTRFADTDNVIFADGGGLKLVELAPNVQHVQGGGANNLIVAMSDHLVVFDAPVGELQSSWVIDAAKAKYPGKPIRYVVLTHHHMDHTGGMRTYVAEGAKVIVPAPGKSYFEKDVRSPHTVVPDELQKRPRTTEIIEVRDEMTLKDDAGSEIRLYNISNPHVQGYLLSHVVKDNILWITDLISPRGRIERSDATVAVGNALRQHGITGALIAGGHGATAQQSDIAPALAAN